MSEWVDTEMAECQMHDARHAKRLATLLTRLGEQPIGSIPSACHGWAETVAAYRFLDNPSVGFEEILSGHKQATLERLRTQEVGLLEALRKLILPEGMVKGRRKPEKT